MMKKIILILIISSNLFTQWNLSNIPNNSDFIYDNGRIYIVSNSGIYFSDNAENNESDNVEWFLLPENENIITIYGVDVFEKVGNYLFISQSFNENHFNYRLYIDNDNIGEWELLPYQTEPFNQIISNQDVIYSTVNNDGIMISFDLGLTWDVIPAPIIGENYFKLLYANNQYLYVSKGCQLFRTMNYGQIWNDITNNLDEIGPPQPYSCTMLYDLIEWQNNIIVSVYWYGGVGTLLVSDNNLETWNLIESFPSNSTVGYYNGVSDLLHKYDILYAGTATSQDGVYYTTDLIQWYEFSDGLTSYNLSVNELASTDKFLYKWGGTINMFYAPLVNQSSSCEMGFTEIEGMCFHNDDLEFLQTLIDNSQETINMNFDDPDSWYWNIIDGDGYYFANGNGIIEPLEIGIKKWEDGRLTSLMCGAYIYCDLSGEIPQSISLLTELNQFRVEGNFLSSNIPPELCEFELDYDDYIAFDVSFNMLCPPFPDCINSDNAVQRPDAVCFNLGDMNYDNNLDVLDVIIIVNLIMYSEYDMLGDINEDATLDIIDIIDLISIILNN